MMMMKGGGFADDGRPWGRQCSAAEVIHYAL